MVEGCIGFARALGVQLSPRLSLEMFSQTCHNVQKGKRVQGCVASCCTCGGHRNSEIYVRTSHWVPGLRPSSRPRSSPTGEGAGTAQKSGGGGGPAAVITLTGGTFWPVRSTFGNIFGSKPPNADFFLTVLQLKSFFLARTIRISVIVPRFLSLGVGAFWHMSEKVPKLPFKFSTILLANHMFWDFDFFPYIGITVRIIWMPA